MIRALKKFIKISSVNNVPRTIGWKGWSPVVDRGFHLNGSEYQVLTVIKLRFSEIFIKIIISWIENFIEFCYCNSRTASW